MEAIEKKSIFDSFHSAEISVERKRFYRNIHNIRNIQNQKIHQNCCHSNRKYLNNLRSTKCFQRFCLQIRFIIYNSSPKRFEQEKSSSSGCIINISHKFNQFRIEVVSAALATLLNLSESKKVGEPVVESVDPVNSCL